VTAELTDKVERTGAQRVRAIVEHITQDAPRLADLGEEQLEQLARVVVAETLKDELRQAADLEKIPYAKERETYLERAGRAGSKHTRLAYRAALDRLEAWCAPKGLSPLELTPSLADDWIESMKAEGLAPSSVHLMVAASSSFWTWLERRHRELHNPFRGTRSRPLKTPARRLEVPSEGEVKLIEKAADGWLRAAVVVMARTGLRAGALPSLSITGGHFTCMSKGREQAGLIPEAARKAIQRAGLPLRSPFEGKKVNKIEDALKYLTKKLEGQGRIRGAYSAHDMRHAFSVRLYRQTHDVYALKSALGHANVAVTEAYLRSLGLER
jgi:site-specific recombinase XerD